MVCDAERTIYVPVNQGEPNDKSQASLKQAETPIGAGMLWVFSNETNTVQYLKGNSRNDLRLSQTVVEILTLIHTKLRGGNMMFPRFFFKGLRVNAAAFAV